MSSSARLRVGQAPVGGGRRPKQTAGDDAHKRKKTRSHTLPDGLVVLYLLFLGVFAAIALRCYRTLPPSNVSGDAGERGPNTFHSRDARKHLEDIVNLGIRHVGNEANEVHAVNLIVQKVEGIRKLASRDVEIEMSVQRVSGSFCINFPDSMTQLYNNVSNIVVRFKKRGTNPEHALLINAHYDSAVGSPAASDDAVSCATMLEILRTLASDPQPFLPDHAIIFLFNGAEETVLQASHGFITQHPWANQVRAFLNLEAAGAGGKEIVFQTGPDHPWLAHVYATVVPHPFASVIAQEVFQSGIIPSDTDFRIFRDYGHIPGIDMAYFVNGYVYHTEYDTADRIPEGSIQRAGENVLSLVRELAGSPLLADPGADRHGKVVFFDILGLFSVVYPERIAVIINSLVVLGSIASVYSGVSFKSQQLDVPSIGMVLTSVLVMILSWLAAITVNVLTALMVDLMSHSMSWFTHTLLILPLYAIPAILALAEVHSFWLKNTSALKAKLCEMSSMHALTLIYTAMLALLTCLRVCSAFYFAMWLFFFLIFRHLTWNRLLRPILPQGLLPRTLFVTCEALSLSVPLTQSIFNGNTVLEFFVPLMGRSGSLLPPDLVIGVLVAVLVCATCSRTVPFVVLTGSRRLRMMLAVCLALLYLAGLALTLSGAVFPYSGGHHPAPKRLFLQHVERRFLNKDGSTRLEDSRVGIVTADYLDLDPISAAVPEIASSVREWECIEAVFCGLPSYLPLMKYINHFWYVTAPPLDEAPSVTLKLLSSETSLPGKRNLTLYMNIPRRASIFIGPRPGQILTRWSLEKFVPSTLPCNHKEPQGDQCHFIFYSRGTGKSESTFWLELEGSPLADEAVEIVVVAQMLDPPLSVTPTLVSLLSSLPDWVTPVAWTASYTSWTF